MDIKIDNIYLDNCLSFTKKVKKDFCNLIIIDPPYNELPHKWDDFNNWSELKNEFDRILKKNGQIYIFGKQPMLSNIYFEFKDLFDFRFELVWDKGKGLWASNYMPMKSHELIWCFKKKGVKPNSLYFDINSIKTPGEPYVRKNKAQSTIRNNWKANLTIYKDGNRFPLSVIKHSSISRREKGEGENHPTQKPLSILEWIIKSSSKENDIILDCFMGSGTTAVAAKTLNRHYLGCEIDNNFYEMSLKRLKRLKKKE